MEHHTYTAGALTGAISATETNSALANVSNRLVYLHDRLRSLNSRLSNKLDEVFGSSSPEVGKAFSGGPATPTSSRIGALHDACSLIEQEIEYLSDQVQRFSQI